MGKWARILSRGVSISDSDFTVLETWRIGREETEDWTHIVGAAGLFP